MNSPEKSPSALLQSRALWALLTVVSLALAWILWPFYGTILWGTIIALLFAPLYRWLLVRLPGRRNVAALLTLLAVVLIVILPLVAVIASLTREAATLYEQVQSGAVNPGQYFMTFLTRCRVGSKRSLIAWASSTGTRCNDEYLPRSRKAPVHRHAGLEHRAKHVRVHGRSVYHALPRVFSHSRWRSAFRRTA